MTLLARSTANSSPLLGLVYTAPASKSLMPWTADPPPDVPASLPEFDVGHTYGHLWPDKDESSRAAVAAVYTARPHAEGGRGASGSA
jgi:hypothetical protein